MTVRFFVDKNNQIPTDSYPLDESDGGLDFIVRNWLIMYPEGKVDFISNNS
jgi:hypothetical protein